MKRKVLVILGLSLLVLSFKSDDLIKHVDSFKIDKMKVDVFFFDPSRNIAKKYQNFYSLSESDMSNTWNEYLHNSILYMFVKQTSKTERAYYLICGNPEVTDSAMFYKVQIVKGITTESFNPNLSEYKNKITKEIKQVNCRGALFEHMDFFDDKKALIGNGVTFLGKFMRIQPYSEIKASMIEIIKNN